MANFAVAAWSKFAAGGFTFMALPELLGKIAG
jgi:hypothetical protein